MDDYKLGEENEKYIKNYMGAGNGWVSGKNKYVLPFTEPATSPTKIWTSNAAINGGITTNAELAEALISWYDEYAVLFKLDANIMIAQAIAESDLKIWNYAGVWSSAMSITQFVIESLHEVLISDKYGKFTDVERQAITKDITGYTYTSKRGDNSQPKDPFYISGPDGRGNRAQLQQNTIDNPKIMIKAQYVYMDFIAKRCDNVASCALFGYNRGPYLNATPKDSYAAWISAASKFPNSPNGNGYEEEGIGYVYNIFKNLYDNFGYKELNIITNSIAIASFDKFNATKG